MGDADESAGTTHECLSFVLTVRDVDSSLEIRHKKEDLGLAVRESDESSIMSN